MLCSAIDCAGVDPAAMAAAVLAATTVTLLALASFVHVSEGRSLVEAERRRTRAEREALAEFASRVENLDADAAPARDGHGHVMQHGPAPRDAEAPRYARGAGSSAESDDSGLAAVRDAYRATVLSVPHYEAEYDESLAANVAAEFGEDVATAVVAGSRLTPALQRELAGRAREAAAHRRQLLDALDREAESLAAAGDRLEGVESRLETLDDCRYRQPADADLADRWQRLRALESDCADLLADRQRHLHGAAPDGGRRGDDGLSFYEYVYRPLSVSFPVLADGLALLDRIRATRGSALDGLTAGA